MTSGGNPYYYVTNNQGAPSVLVDNSGVKQDRWDYGPTGSARPGTTEPVDQPFGYTGAYLGTTGLYHMGARYYDQSLGRFTQPDPAGKESNAYLYAGADYINNVDPTGDLSWKLSIEGCYIVCVSGGLTHNSDGSLHPSLGLGVGSPSVNGGLEESASDAGSGGSLNAECGAGNATLSASNSGDVSVGAGTEYHSDPECSVTGEYTW